MARSSQTRELTQTQEDTSGVIPDELRPPRESQEGTGADQTAAPAPSKTPAIDALLQWCRAQADLNGDDSMAGLESIVRQTLASDDPSRILRQTMPQSGQRFVNVPMLWSGYTIRDSDYEDGSGAPFYATLEVMVGDPPEPRVINCGGWRVLAQVAAIATAGEWPQVVMVIETGKAKKGQSPPLMLVQVDADGNPAGAV